jgi:hypothetical protein
VRSEDYHWLHALTTPPLLTTNATRLAQEGVSPAAADRAVALVERSLVEEGPLTRAELGDRIAASGVRTEGQALVHILMLATLRGVAVRGPMHGRQHAYALVRDWLGPPPSIDRDEALAELARRFLAGHGPASDRDLAKWAGLPLRDARAALAAIAPSLEERADRLVDLGGRPPAVALPRPKLLGAFDPILLGWMPRDPFLGAHAPAIVQGGMFNPFALVRGRAAGTWRIVEGKVEVEPFGRLARGDAAALDAEAADVERFLELRC